MAKKKHKKKTKKGFEYKLEVYGLLFLLAAILGIGKYGPVGRIISSFALFLVGSIYMVLLVVFFIVGAYLLIKREWPDFFSTKLIGLYVFVIGFLIIMHQDFVLQNDGNMMLIFKATIDQLVSAFNGIMNTGILEDWYAVGGGIVGGMFAILFDKLFSYTGMQIVSWVLMGCGFCLFTGFSILEFAKEKMMNQKEKMATRKEKKALAKEKKNVIISNGNENEDLPEEKSNHIKINDISELTKVSVQEDKQVEEVQSSLKPTGSGVNHSYQLPPLSLLDQPRKKQKETDGSVIEKNIEILEKVLKDFKIVGKVVEVHIGPTVAQYELEIASGTRVNKTTSINRTCS